VLTQLKGKHKHGLEQLDNFNATALQVGAQVSELGNRLANSKELAKVVDIVSDPVSADTREMLSALADRFIPNKVVVLRPPDPEATVITRIAPYTEYYRRIDDRATAYVCLDHKCELPTTSISKMLELLGVKQ